MIDILFITLLCIICGSLSFLLGYLKGYKACEIVLKRYIKYDEKPGPDYHKLDTSDLIWCNKCLHYTKGCVICHKCHKDKTLS